MWVGPNTGSPDNNSHNPVRLRNKKVVKTNRGWVATTVIRGPG